MMVKLGAADADVSGHQALNPTLRWYRLANVYLSQINTPQTFQLNRKECDPAPGTCRGLSILRVRFSPRSGQVMQLLLNGGLATNLNRTPGEIDVQPVSAKVEDVTHKETVNNAISCFNHIIDVARQGAAAEAAPNQSQEWHPTRVPQMLDWMKEMGTENAKVYCSTPPPTLQPERGDECRYWFPDVKAEK